MSHALPVGGLSILFPLMGQGRLSGTHQELCEQVITLPLYSLKVRLLDIVLKIRGFPFGSKIPSFVVRVNNESKNV